MILDIRKPLNQLLDSKSEICRAIEYINDDKIVIARKQIDIKMIISLKKYLTNVGRNSIPNYHPIEVGAPNSHRINNLDERSFVKGCFHQFSFYPWNQDYFNLFSLTKSIFQFKNLISGISKNKFLSEKGEGGCVARLSFQFYPKGSGILNKHKDPVDAHQISIPILIMSSKSEDFKYGGAYVDIPHHGQIYLEEIAQPGDVVFFKATLPHGVDKIDPESAPDWLSFQGRWMLLMAVNKIASNARIGNAQELDS